MKHSDERLERRDAKSKVQGRDKDPPHLPQATHPLGASVCLAVGALQTLSLWPTSEAALCKHCWPLMSKERNHTKDTHNPYPHQSKEMEALSPVASVFCSLPDTKRRAPHAR